MKKKLTIAALVVMLVALLLTGMSIAYFTDTEDATNVFTVGNVDITLEEPNWDPDGDGPDDDDILDNVVPGVTYPKDPTIKNVGANPAYIRVEVAIEGYTGNTLAPSAFLQNLDTTNFTVQTNSDNLLVLHSNTELAPGGILTVFDGVQLPAELTDAELEAGFTITVTAKAIQSEGFATAEDAFNELTASTTTPPSANP